MIRFYFLRFFLLVYLVVFFAIICILAINEVILEIIDRDVNFKEIFFKTIDFIIIFLELIVSLSFVASFCIYFIKFSKSFEFIALRSLGISYKSIYTPIFYFSLLCGVFIYINQSYFASCRQTKLLKNYDNFASEWLVDDDKLSYFNKEDSQLIRFFIPTKNKSMHLSKIEVYNTNTKQIFDIADDKIIINSSTSSPKFLHKQKKNFLEVKNFFYLKFIDLYPFVLKKNDLFSYIFFQKIADILNPVFLFFIFLGRPLDPRNTDLEKTMMFRSSLCVFFIFTSQIGIFLFKANSTHPFLYAFLNHMVWGSVLLVRFLRYEKNQ